MEKTIFFNKDHASAAPHHQADSKCINCQKLEKQIVDLTQLLSHTQTTLQNIINGSENQLINFVQAELVELHDKYAALKKRVTQVEKENDDLFAENTRLEKQLSVFKAQPKQEEQGRKNTPRSEAIHSAPLETRLQGDSAAESQRKQAEIELFVWQERVRQLETMGREQGDEIVKLKEYLRKRNKQQAERHRLLQQFS